MMTLLQLEVLLAVVETGSFTKAAEALNLSQSGVSHTIAGLEAELGIALLTRNRNGIKLTEAGEQILIHAREIWNRSEQIKQVAAAAKGLQIGTIRVGSFPSASAKLLPGMIRSFRNRYPGIELVLLEGSYEEIKAWIAAGAIDVGFLPSPSEGIETVPLIRDELVVILPASNRLNAADSLSIEQIADEPFVMPKAGCEALVEEAFRGKQLVPNTEFEVVENSTILSMVQAGLGISVVPRLVLPDTLDGIAVISLSPPLFRQSGIGARSLTSASPAVLAFLQEAQSWAS